MRHSLRDPKTGRFIHKRWDDRKIKIICGLETMKELNKVFSDFFKETPILFKRKKG
jgi:hypothetical protein